MIGKSMHAVTMHDNVDIATGACKCSNMYFVSTVFETATAIRYPNDNIAADCNLVSTFGDVRDDDLWIHNERGITKHQINKAKAEMLIGNHAGVS